MTDLLQYALLGALALVILQNALNTSGLIRGLLVWILTAVGLVVLAIGWTGQANLFAKEEVDSKFEAYYLPVGATQGDRLQLVARILSQKPNAFRDSVPADSVGVGAHGDSSILLPLIKKELEHVQPPR